MKFKNHKRGIVRQLTLLLLMGACLSASATAEVRWRISVKFILDANGNRPAGNVSTDQDVIAQFDRGRAALVGAQRGFDLELVEIIDVAGIEFLHESVLAEVVEDTVLGDSALGWRWNAINIYVTDGELGGQCSFSQGTPSEHTIIIGRHAPENTLMHEVGHYFDLCHTQGCPCGECQNSCLGVIGDDNIPDTIADRACWNRDDISLANFSVTYDQGTFAQRSSVDAVWHNVMSYHPSTDRFTEHQMHAMSYASNYRRNYVASGRALLVNGQSAVDGNGEFWNPTRTVSSALSLADSGDVLTIVSDAYSEGPLVITDAVTLAAAWGSVTIE